MSRYFVTGAGGLVGGHLAETLAAEGHEVRCLTRRAHSEKTPNRVEWIEADLLDPARYRGAINGCDAVFHAAGLLASTRPEAYRRVNVDGTEALLAACASLRVRPRVVCLSSIAAQGPHFDGALLRETDPCRPRSEYGRSKYEGENVALSFADDMEITVLRPAFVHGPRDTRGPAHLRLILAAAPDRWRTNVRTSSFVHVCDLVRAMRLAAGVGEAAIIGGAGTPSRPAERAPRAPIYIVAERRVYDWAAVGAALRDATDDLVKSGRIHESRDVEAARERFSTLSTRVALPRLAEEWGCDVEKARRDLGFEATRTLREGARDAVLACVGAAASALPPAAEPHATGAMAAGSNMGGLGEW